MEAIHKRWKNINEWRQIISAITEIKNVYDKMNYIMSLGLEKKVRLTSLGYIASKKITSLIDIGSGPGTSIRLVENYTPYLIALDPSYDLLKQACKAINYKCDRLNAVVEYMPLRANSIDFATAFFSARDFIDFDKGLKEIARTTRKGTIIGDIFVPNKFFWRLMLIIWTCIIVPILALVITPRYWKNYRELCRTLRKWIPIQLAEKKMNNYIGKTKRINIFDSILGVLIAEPK